MTDQHTSPTDPDTGQYSLLELRNRWVQRWHDSLSSLLDVGPTSDRISDLLQQSASNGNSERALAGDHETRELIELLQNGRDAIRKGRKEGRGGGATGGSTETGDRGQVYISIHDTGLLVANTGAPFDFLDEEVEEAVCMVGESSKHGLDYIGSKGVGLKSVLASGEAVEFWTSLDESPSQSADGAGSDPLRIRLSRAYTTSAIYASLGITPDTPVFEAHCRELEGMGEGTDSALLDELLTSRHPSGTSPSKLGPKPRERIAKQPLFYLPVELDPNDRNGTLAEQARALVTGEGPGTAAIEKSQQGAFRTAVFIEYIDEAWRELLPELPQALQSEVFARQETRSSGSETSAPTDGRAPVVARQLWAQLTGDLDQDGLQPETLVQLGEIDELVAARVQKATDSVATETKGETGQPDTSPRVSWTIDPSKSDRETQMFEIGPGVRYQSLTVKRKHGAGADGETTSRSFVFDVFERPDDWDYEPPPDDTDEPPAPRILIPSDENGASLSELQEYPLNLYYPIENTTQLALPFCLHGRFRVQTNRKDLSPNERDYNKWVLDACNELIRAIAEHTARDEKFGSLYPWVLLPPDPKSRSSRGTSDVLREFVDDVYDSIRSSECFPQETTVPVPPGDSLFHWNPDVVDGFAAYFALTESSEGVEPEAPDGISLPSRALVDGFLQFRQQLKPRVRTVLTAETDSSAWTDAVADDWLQVLTTISSHEKMIQCRQHTGRTLFAGLAQLLVPDQETADDDIKSVVESHEAELHGTPLLPCLHRKATAQGGDEPAQADPQRLSDGTQGDDLLLVPVESLNISKDRGNRTVLWNLTGTEGGADLRAPPADAGFTVYFFDPKTEQRQDVPRVLQNVSRLWGMREYEDQQNYYRSLVHSFARSPSEQTTLPSEAISFLADHVAEITAEDLSTSEGGFIPSQYLKKALSDSGGATAQRRQLRRRLAIRDAELGLNTPATDPGTAIRDLSVGDAWQRLRSIALDGRTDDGNKGHGITEWADYTSLCSTVLPKPSDESWDPVYETTESTASREQQQCLVAETLSLVGVSVFSGLTVIWLFGPDHPTTPHWSPSEWGLPEGKSETSNPQSSLDSLSDTLDDHAAYLDLIAGPGYHPAETIDHSSTCNGSLASSNTSGGNLGSWIWLANLGPLQQEPANTIELLQRHDEQLVSSVLRTGWTCNGGQHNRYSWNQPVPTLFNWQLRTLPIWELELSDDMQDAWGEAGKTLRWALPESEGHRPTAADLFPQVTEATQLTPALRDAFGIHPIEELTPVGIADRLQQLLEVRTDVPLSNATADHICLDVEKHDRRWQSAYNQLVSRLTQHFETVSGDDDTPVPFVTELDVMTHFPVKHEGEWVAADIEMLRSRGEVRHFEDRSPKFWEKNKAQESDDDLYILVRPRSGSFTPLRDHFGSEDIDANPPTITETDGIDINFDFDGREAIQNRLKERRQLLIAAMERTNEAEIKDTEQKLTAAIEQLAACIFPENIERHLELLDTSSGIYIPEDTDTPGIILNQNILNEEMSDKFADSTTESFEAKHASIGLSLLVRRPGKFREFEHTLRHDFDSLQQEYEGRFPLEIVQRALGTKRVHEFRRRLHVLSQLLTGLDIERDMPEPGTMVSFEDENADKRIQRFESIITDDDTPSPDTQERDQTQLVQHALELRELLPEWANFVADVLFGQHSEPSYDWWCQKIATLAPERRHKLIAWLAENRTFFDLQECSSSARLRCENFEEVARLITEVEAEQRATASDWRTEIEQENASVSWTDQIEGTVALGAESPSTEYPNQWFFYAGPDRFRSELAEPILRLILSDAGADESEGIRELITGYIFDNDLQPQKTRANTRDRQHEAFETVSSMNTDRWEAKDLDAFSSAGASWDDGLEVNAGSGRTGGGGGSSTGRPQQAEAFTMVHILRRLRDWIGGDPKRAEQLLSGFRELKADQEALLEQLSSERTALPPAALEFKWHLPTKWPGLSSGLDMAPQDVIEHLASLNSSGDPPLAESPLLKLINVTQEQGPGFDSIDPFGPLQASYEPAADGSTFAAVEMKAVRGDPPYGFRITSNELRRCRSFLGAKNRIENETGTTYLSTGSEYVIRFIRVPSADTNDWTAATDFAGPDLILTEERLKRLFSSDPLEFSVKGGYVNLTLDG